MNLPDIWYEILHRVDEDNEYWLTLNRINKLVMPNMSEVFLNWRRQRVKPRFADRYFWPHTKKSFRFEYSTAKFSIQIFSWALSENGNNPGGRAVQGADLLPLLCRDSRFESRWGHRFLSLVFVLCRQRPLQRADDSCRGVLPFMSVWLSIV